MNDIALHDKNGQHYTSWTFQAYNCYPNRNNFPGILDLDEFVRKTNHHLMVSININGGGHRSLKIVRMYESFR